MSIYKGGYILADISDIPLTETPEDFLPQDLKDYLNKFVKNSHFSKEVLLKPIKLLITDINECKKLITLDMITDDTAILYSGYVDGNNSILVNIDVDTFAISCNTIILQTEQ